ncbi:MAG: cyclic nucleotide-binding domain-containing protein [Thermoanaerobaculia bacterium]
MKRKVILSKEAVLWESGDAARSFAVLEHGKLGIKTARGLAGVIWPGMALGEGSILTMLGEPQIRTATVFAMTDETLVVEYPAIVAQESFDSSQVICRNMLTTLVGQIARDSMLLMNAQKHNPLVSLPFNGLLQGILRSYKTQIASLMRWEDFVSLFRYLHATRNYAEAMRNSLMVASADKEAIFRASEFARDFLKDPEEAALLQSFLSAEGDRSDWIERHQAS